MAEMNKRPGGRVSELEADLIGDITDAQALVETGKDEVKNHNTAGIDRKYRKLNIQQGHRYRHPDRVLNRYAAINKDTEHAESVWEQALVQEDTKTKLPQTYKPSGYGMVGNQLGLDEVALKNFKTKKNKLGLMNVVINT